LENEACAWFGALHIYVDKQNPDGTWKQVKHITTSHPISIIGANTVKYQFETPGKYKLSYHQDCTPVGGADVNGTDEYEVIATPIVQLSTPSPPAGKLWYTVGDTLAVSGELFYFNLKLEKVYITDPMTIEVTTSCGANQTINTSTGRFLIPITLTRPGLCYVTAKSSPSSSYRESLPSLPVILLTAPKPSPYVKLKIPLPPGGISWKINQDIPISGEVHSIDATTFEDALVKEDLDVIINYGGASPATVKAKVGIFSTKIKYDTVGVFGIYATSQAGTNYSASLPSLPVIVAISCPDGQLWDPVSGTCFTPLSVTFDTASFSLVREGEKKTIIGHVTDLSNHPIVGKTVTLLIRRVATGVAFPAIITKPTDASGTFTAEIPTAGFISTKPFPEVIAVSPIVTGSTQTFIPALFTVYIDLGFAILKIDPILPSPQGADITVRGTLYSVTTMAGLDKAPISLYDSAGTKIGSTITAGGGVFEFKGLTAPDSSNKQPVWLCSIGFDGLPGVPQYDASPQFPVFIFTYRPTAYLTYDKYSLSFVEKPFLDTSTERTIRVSGKLMTYAMTGEMGGITPVPAPAGESILLEFGGVITPMPTVTKTDGVFDAEVTVPAPTQLLSAILMTISYTGTRYNVPIPASTTIILYKPISLGGAGGVFPSLNWRDILLTGGIVAGSAVVIAGIAESRRKR
jgi:hypothetical protein